MIHVLFEIGGEACALPAAWIERVVPWTRVRPVPCAPEYVRGLLNYRGASVPVIDMACMLGHPKAPPALSSRILLVRYPFLEGESESPLLGLLAVSAVETVDLDPSNYAAPGIRVEESACLGAVVVHEGKMLQIVDVERILPESLKKSLFDGNGLAKAL